MFNQLKKILLLSTVTVIPLGCSMPSINFNDCMLDVVKNAKLEATVEIGVNACNEKFPPEIKLSEKGKSYAALKATLTADKLRKEDKELAEKNGVPLPEERLKSRWEINKKYFEKKEQFKLQNCQTSKIVRLAKDIIAKQDEMNKSEIKKFGKELDLCPSDYFDQ